MKNYATTQTRVGQSSKRNAATGSAAFSLARRANDPLVGKLLKAKKLYLMTKLAIMKKYGMKAKSYVMSQKND